MKKIVLLLLLSGSMYAQKQVYNVQRYCIDEQPFLPKCPCCKTGNLHRIAVFDQRGPPAWYLGGSQSSSSYEN